MGADDASWFVSVLEKLGDLGKTTVADVIGNPSQKLRWRLHEIDWNHRGTPIKRSDLDWLAATYLKNEAEYPLWQFQVSTALGRVIGFWDELGSFNIVLLDRMHNLQPSSYSDYKLRAAPIALGEFASAIQIVEAQISTCGADCGCRQLYPKIQSALTHRLAFETMLVPMTNEMFNSISEALKRGLADCIGDILDVGLKTLAPLLTGVQSAEAASGTDGVEQANE